MVVFFIIFYTTIFSFVFSFCRIYLVFLGAYFLLRVCCKILPLLGVGKIVGQGGGGGGIPHAANFCRASCTGAKFLMSEFLIRDSNKQAILLQRMRMDCSHLSPRILRKKLPFPSHPNWTFAGLILENTEMRTDLSEKLRPFLACVLKNVAIFAKKRRAFPYFS